MQRNFDYTEEEVWSMIQKAIGEVLLTSEQIDMDEIKNGSFEDLGLHQAEEVSMLIIELEDLLGFALPEDLDLTNFQELFDVVMAQIQEGEVIPLDS